MTGVAIITGAGSGIGRAVARTLMEAGWQTGLIGRREDALKETAKGHAQALVLPCDVRVAGAVDAAFARAASAFGRIDLLFNNAGLGLRQATIDDMSPDDWHQVIGVNLTGAFLCARAAFRQMRAQSPQGGRIINNGSISAHVPRPGSAAYTASKHGITGLTKTIALDGRPYAIACGQIDIGNAATDMAARMQTGTAQADLSVKVEPVMDVAEVARSVLYMADLPPSANALFLTVMATSMPFVGRG